ncbi:hypothetical protein [Mangrovicoccus ximenensis]|uniref:hypothetical protein n=1 Tax=Mangrovicoccus ximenensis TaxID=1911570 RepID=UPI000D3C5B6A|nr:hypothetical protein [Mangrovicoccus ximenensis]
MRAPVWFALGLGHAVLAAVSAGLAAFVTVMLLSGAAAPLRTALGGAPVPVATCPMEVQGPHVAAAIRERPPPERENAGFSRPKPLDLGPRAPFIPAD